MTRRLSAREFIRRICAVLRSNPLSITNRRLSLRLRQTPASTVSILSPPTILSGLVAVALTAALASGSAHAGNRAAANNSTPAEMAQIKGGCFDMGDVFHEGNEDESPIHRVCLDDYALDAREATQADYEKVTGKIPSTHKDCPNCPVEWVNWGEAKSFCEKVHKRLPTEAEWEYAAREGGKKIRYGTGKDEESLSSMNFTLDNRHISQETKPVGEYPPNALGLYDMSGNVLEWTADWYDEKYRNKDGVKNPKGPSSGLYKTARGGAWTQTAFQCRATRRSYFNPENKNDSLGFRCAK